MRAREFTINVPINIKINGDDEPEVSTGDEEGADLQQNPVMVSPLQQHLELQKAQQGKESPVVDKITQDDDIGAEPSDDDIGAEPNDDDRLLDKIKQLISR